MTDEKQSDAERADLVQDYGQALLDVLLSDKTLEHIPVIKTVVAAAKAAVTVRDCILVKNIRAFIEALADVPADQRASMVQRLESDPRYNRKVGLHLIELLDRIDSHRKPTMIGHAFAAYAQERIDAKALQRLIAAIEALPSHEIDVVRRVANAIGSNRKDLANVDPESTYAIISAGLAHSEFNFSGEGLKLTPTCSLFLQLNLDTPSERR